MCVVVVGGFRCVCCGWVWVWVWMGQLQTRAPILLTFILWIVCCRHISSVVKGLTVAWLSQLS